MYGLSTGRCSITFEGAVRLSANADDGFLQSLQGPSAATGIALTESEPIGWTGYQQLMSYKCLVEQVSYLQLCHALCWLCKSVVAWLSCRQ